MSKTNINVPEIVHILININELKLVSEDLTETRTSKNTDLPYKLGMSYPVYKPSNQIIKRNNNKEIIPGIFIIDGYFIDKNIIKQTKLGKGLNNKKLLDIFTKRKLLTEVFNSAYRKGIITKPKNEQEKREILEKNIIFVLDLIFKNKNNFNFPYRPLKNKTIKNINENKKIILNKKIFSYIWKDKRKVKNEKTYSDLFEDSTKINPIYITEFDKYYKLERRLKQINIKVQLNLYNTTKINNNETKKLKCKDSKTQLKYLLNDIYDVDDDKETNISKLAKESLFYKLFEPLLIDYDDKYKDEKQILFQNKIMKNLDKVTDDFEVVTKSLEPKKDIIDDVNNIIKSLEDKGIKDLKVPNSFVLLPDGSKEKNLEYEVVSQIIEREKRILKKDLINILKEYYIQKNKEKIFNESLDTFLGDDIFLLYNKYLIEIGKDEDKFFDLLKSKLKTYEKLSSTPNIVYIKDVLYKLILLKKDYELKNKNKNN